jgi:hypothetical protein
VGEVGDIDWTCEHCQARRFMCIVCGEVVIVDDDPESEMRERCFRTPRDQRPTAAPRGG